jgi:hypothetical protein
MAGSRPRRWQMNLIMPTHVAVVTRGLARAAKVSSSSAAVLAPSLAMLRMGAPAYVVHARGGVLPTVAPARPVLCLIEPPIEVAPPILWLACGPLRVSLP